MTTRTGVVVCLCALLVAALVDAAAADMRQAEVDRLAEARDRLLSGSQSVKPSQAARMRGDAATLQKMIDASDKGRPLDPSKVSHAIEDAELPH